MENISGFYMSTPIVIPLITGFISLIIQNDMLLYFSSTLAFTDIFIVHLLKYLCKILYEFVGVKNFVFLGRGIRPDGAMNCGCFIDKNNVNKLATSYGMPSGHSLVAGFMLAFFYKYIINTYPDSIKRKIALIALFLFSISIAISRIILNCHTIQQVIVGFLIGLYIGSFFYDRQKYILNIVNS